MTSLTAGLKTRMSSSMIWNAEDVDFFLGMLIDTDELLKDKNILEDGFKITDDSRDDDLKEIVDDSLEFTDDEVSMVRGEDCLLIA